MRLPIETPHSLRAKITNRKEDRDITQSVGSIQ